MDGTVADRYFLLWWKRYCSFCLKTAIWRYFSYHQLDESRAFLQSYADVVSHTDNGLLVVFIAITAWKALALSIQPESRMNKNRAFDTNFFRSPAKDISLQDYGLLRAALLNHAATTKQCIVHPLVSWGSFQSEWHELAVEIWEDSLHFYLEIPLHNHPEPTVPLSFSDNFSKLLFRTCMIPRFRTQRLEFQIHHL